MFVSVVAELQVDKPMSIPITHGEAMQAEFLRRVSELDSGVAVHLHGGRDGKTRPYTISQIQVEGETTVGDGRRYLQPGCNAWFRLTAIGALPSQAVLALSESLNSWMQFGIRRWSVFPEEHSWSGVTKLDDVFQSAWTSMEREPDGAVLHFHSPTAFETASGGGWAGWMPLPIPRLVFGSLRARTLGCTAIEEPPLPPNFIDEHVALGQFHDISSRLMSFQRHGYHRAGFTGVCEFRFDRKMPEPARVWLHLLANLAFYLGVGKDTTRGMGQVRRATA
ncbi:MAG TPA: CRISPR system precrRNA processing endoribonuclease RAMP protein Cas6 [Terriglobia bacterium]|nr:CRISPR system precrRNA processing endoribonuclease RAMP protein Cas6 [Terriglobia bacterium]